MITRYEDTLAYLASLAVQERFIVHATADQYLLPEELIDGALNFKIFLATFPKETSAAELAALTQFSESLDAAVDAIDLGPDTTSESLIHHDPAWASVRDAARKCLDALGFDLPGWEKEQGL
jgi:hypothetical protein